jgi:serine/threonine-protein kinase
MAQTTDGDTPSGRDASVTGAPDRLGRYRVVRPLGAGGMGTVYLAHDETLGRDVAIKTLHAAFPMDDTTRQRFLNEAKAVASLDHPNIVAVHDLGVEGQTPYLVMELVRGRSLAQILAERGRLSPSEVCTIGIQMARALARAHEAGILHRDVKPGNILEAGPGQWKLADFGVARLPDSSLTMTGMFIGTPAYGAPESLTAGEFAPPGDVFSLGAVLYECLTGSWIQKGKDVLRAAVAYATTNIEPPSRHCSGAPAGLDAALLAAVAAKPEARPTAAAFAEALAGGGVEHKAVGSFVPAAGPPVLAAGVAPTVIVESTVRPVATPRRPMWIWLAIGITCLVLLALVLSRTQGSASERAASPGDVATSGREPADGEPMPAMGTGERERAAQEEAAATAESADEPPWPDLSSLSRPHRPWRGKAKGHGRDKQRERWEKAQEKFYEGKPDEAAYEIERILEDDPDDAAADQWLRWYEENASDLPMERKRSRWDD